MSNIPQQSEGRETSTQGLTSQAGQGAAQSEAAQGFKNEGTRRQNQQSKPFGRAKKEESRFPKQPQHQQGSGNQNERDGDDKGGYVGDDGRLNMPANGKEKVKI
jgi:hypothetical protein